jgi:exodeoxyribonuclease VII small subunit
MKKEPEVTFEQAMSRLEEIVETLDSGERPLNESLQLFEEGVKLTRECSRQLTEAQGKLEMLVKNSDASVSTEALLLTSQ